MTATLNALYTLNAGSAISTAFPQNASDAQNLDLIQIVAKTGGAMLAKVDYTGAVTGGDSGSGAAFVLTAASLNSLVLTSAAVNSFVLTSVVGATGVYHGTITGGDSNAFVGKTVVVSGFTASAGANNGTFVITASSATTFTVAVTTQVDETATGAALVVGVTKVTFAGTITGGGTNAFAGKTVVIGGFAAGSGENNGTYVILSNDTSSIVALATAANANETHSGTALVVGVTHVTFAGTITDGGTNLFAGRSVTIAGFAANTGANNGVYNIISNSTSQIVALATAASVAETHAGTATLGLITGTNGTRVGEFATNQPASATIAQLFADAFTNPSQQDVLQIINVGGNISYYLNYLGVPTGS